MAERVKAVIIHIGAQRADKAKLLVHIHGLKEQVGKDLQGYKDHKFTLTRGSYLG
jgi:hypothetical protein